jgi:S1-C subfamily serine protease
LHQMNMGDEQLRGQIDTLNERILSLEATMGNTRTAKAERRGLLLRLAAPILAEETAPGGAENEHRKAREAQAALLNYQEERAARSARPSSRSIRWRRIAVGYAVLGCAALLFFLWSDFGVADPEESPGRQANAGDHAPSGNNPPDKKGKARHKKKDGTKWKTEKRASRENKPAAQGKPAEEADKPARKQKPADEQKAPRDKFVTLKASVALIRGARGRACGFLVRDNLLVTTYSLVKDTGPGRLEVYFPSAGEPGIKPLPYKVLDIDPVRNLAFLLVKTHLAPLPFADRHQFQRGQKVMVISNPDQETGDPEENVVLQGHWQAKVLLLRNRSFDAVRLTSKPLTLGGPLLNAAGKVVGLVTFRQQGLPEVVYGIPLQDLQKAIRLAESRQ